ncbi:MAG: hypothetical protein ABJA37_12720 [Ferruginibacter sp.]
MEVLVFKTNLIDHRRINEVESSLNFHPHIVKWNVDLNDCDNILRIVSSKITATEIETLLWNAGYYCKELQ